MVQSKDGKHLQLGADRYGFEVLKSEDKWRKKYPNIAKKIDELEKQVKDLTNKRDKNRPIKKD